MRIATKPFFWMSLIGFLCTFPSTAQTSFENLYPIGSTVSNTWIEACPDGSGHVMVVSNQVGQFPGIAIVKVDNQGDVRWVAGSPLLLNHSMQSLMIARNGDIYVGGGGYNNGEQFTLIFCLDSTGNQKWSHWYRSDRNRSFVYDIMESPQGGIYLFGLDGNQAGVQEFCITKLDETGAVEFSNVHLGTFLWARAVVTSDDAVVAYTQGQTFKINSQGQEVWSKKVELPAAFRRGQAVVALPDNGIACVAQNSLNEFILFKMDAQGNVVWSSPATRGRPGSGLRLLGDGTFAISGVAIDNIEEVPAVFQFSADGEHLRTISYRGPNGNRAANIIRMAPANCGGGLMLIGRVAALPISGQNVLLIKTKADLTTACSEELPVAPTDPTTTITVSNAPLSTRSVPTLAVDANLTLVLEGTVPKTTTCEDSEPLTINLGPDTAVCELDSYPLDAGINSGTYLWNTQEDTRAIVAQNPGIYWVTVTDACGASGSDTIEIIDLPVPVAAFSVSATSGEPDEEFQFTDASQGADQWDWDFGDGGSSTNPSPSYAFKDNDDYSVTLVVSNDEGCTDTAWQNISIYLQTLFVPNAFSPNIDGHNETFGPIGFGIASYELNIYNRWGQNIYTGTDEPWNGDNAQEGVYVYKLSVVTDRGERLQRQGVVTLLL